MKGSILLVCVDGALREALREALERAGYLVVTSRGGDAAEAVVRGLSFDAVVVQGDGEVLRRVSALAGAMPVVSIEGRAGEEVARLLSERLGDNKLN
jgi:DNA-binding response OmpR family regulator